MGTQWKLHGNAKGTLWEHIGDNGNNSQQQISYVYGLLIYCVDQPFNGRKVA